jgi:plastocyanin
MKISGLLVLFGVFLMIGEPTANAATLTGKVAFDGQPPATQKLKMDADANCKLMHPEGVEDDSVLVNANGTLKNVFVYVKEGLKGKKFDAPKDAVKFDQKGCQYSPKVFGIMTGQPLEIINSDNTLHNVHSLSNSSPQFNLGMPIQGMKLKKTFAKPEVMVKIKCDVHPWMAAYAGVLDHPFYAVTGDDGSFEIKNLPPGEYVVEAWHEKFGVQSQNVTIAAEGDAQDAPFQFKA